MLDKREKILRVIKLIVLIVVALIAVSFASLNAEGAVAVDYYLGERDVPVIALILGVLSLGIVLGVLLMLGPYLSARRRCFVEHRQVVKLEKQQAAPKGGVKGANNRIGHAT